MGDFETAGYAVLVGLIDPAERDALRAHAVEMASRATAFREDPQVPNTPSAYADPEMESLLGTLRPKIEAATGRALYPTYSYYRVYKRGDELKKHTDRESCEVSVSLCLGYVAPTSWPLFVESGGAPKRVVLEAGDALLYKGIVLPHWREPFDGEQAVQVFLHYVDKKGPYAEWRYDRRASLNV